MERLGHGGWCAEAKLQNRREYLSGPPERDTRLRHHYHYVSGFISTDTGDTRNTDVRDRHTCGLRVRVVRGDRYQGVGRPPQPWSKRNFVCMSGRLWRPQLSQGTVNSETLDDTTHHGTKQSWNKDIGNHNNGDWVTRHSCGSVKRRKTYECNDHDCECISLLQTFRLRA